MMTMTIICSSTSSSFSPSSQTSPPLALLSLKLLSPLYLSLVFCYFLLRAILILRFILLRGGDLAPSLGDGKNFRGPRFLDDDFFMKKFPFTRPKFLMTFFSHRHGFSDFPLFTVIKCPIRPFL